MVDVSRFELTTSSSSPFDDANVKCTAVRVGQWTDCCYAGVLLALLSHSHNKVLNGCLGRCGCLLGCLLAGCLLNEGARQSLLLEGDNACQVW